MTRDDITRMAREAGFVGFDGENKCLREFAALATAAAVAAEREALCQWIETEFASYERADNIVAAIRARGEK